MNNIDLERFHKQMLVSHIGEVGMQKLSNSTVAFLGLGGGGSVGAHQFTLSNVGRIILCDHDTVEYSNLGRQYLYNEETIGMHKVTAAKKFLNKLNPGVEIIEIPQKVNGNILNELAKQYENLLIYVAIDKWERHFFINNFCIENGIRAVHMGSLGFKGFVYTYDPKLSHVCFECAMRKGYMGNTDVSLIDTEDTVYPYLPPVISVAGSLAVVEGIKLLLDNSAKSIANSFLMYRGINHQDILEDTPIRKPLIEQVFLEKNAGCPTCAKCV
jgi:adenylyltransferase/sulfurtransferase